jgi:hypothetical protein
MVTTRRMTAFLGLVFVVGCASAGDRIRTQVLDDGSRIEWNAAGNPVRFMDTSGKLFATNRSLQVEQVFDDGSRIEWSAAGNPVRATDTSGNVVGEKLTQTVAAR